MMLLFAPTLSRADKAEAKRLRDLAIVAAEQQHDLPAAIQYARDALKAFDSPNLHYNLALLLRDNGQAVEAAAEFKLFLAAPSAEVQARTQALLETKGAPSKGLPIGLGVGAVGVLAIGAGLLGSAVTDYGSLQNDCKLRPCAPNDWQGAEARGNAGYALLAIGSAVAVVDVVLWGLTAKRKAHHLEVRF
jgi:hypothetical protein